MCCQADRREKGYGGQKTYEDARKGKDDRNSEEHTLKEQVTSSERGRDMKALRKS